MPSKTEFKCLNKHCLAPVEIPGRCGTCAEMWAHTCAVAATAYGLDNEDDDEDDMGYYYEPQEDFGADLGISPSDPMDYWD